MAVSSPNRGVFASRGDHSSSSPNFYTGRPRGVVGSGMAHLVPEDRGNSAPESDDSVFGPYSRVLTLLREKLHGDGGDLRLLAIEVHAIMQESGFVAADPVNGTPARPFHHADRWLRRKLSVSYSLPELVAGSDGPYMPEGVLLIFDCGPYGIKVSGFLLNAGWRATSLGLDAGRFSPAYNAGWRATSLRLDVSGFAPAIREGNDPEANEFRKMVKDRLALPLLIRLTERVGLPLPPCFMRLPKELKLKILEPLPGSDLLRVGRVCSELRRLTSNNDDLWKRKYEEEFEMPRESSGITNWKQRFACELEKERRRRSPPPWGEVLDIIRIRYGLPRPWVPPPLNM